MITFIVAVALLIAGYFLYGKFVSHFFGASSEIATPVKRLADGVDYQGLKPWRIFVIQFLNIAGLGPIFGAILGAAYGPLAFVWIVIGCIFLGAVHDYFSGMLSVQHDGMSLPDLVGKYLGDEEIHGCVYGFSFTGGRGFFCEWPCRFAGQPDGLEYDHLAVCYFCLLYPGYIASGE